MAVGLTAATTKACRVCGDSFLPFTSTQIVCSVKCARKVPVIARQTLQADRKATKIRLEALQPLSHWIRRAQQAFNAWIRSRDAHLPCISCGRFHGGKWNAGHFQSVGARPELRFDEDNVHRQCEPCNTHLSGNLINYRAELIKRKGQAVVDRLEGPIPPKRYRADDLKAITADYRARLKALTKDD